MRISVIVAVLAACCEVRAQDVPPLLPIPTARQLDWQYDEMRLFLHFGVNTFTDREWGTGEEDPAVFDPEQFDAGQWVRVARETGFPTVILTAKHHDGFALWPSRYTQHSVASSPGARDIVGGLAEAASAEDVKLGLYLSPWDRHESTYGDEEAYNVFYMGQLRELLTRYGPLAEVWFDGAKGEDARDMNYHFDAYWAMVRQLQPGAVLFSDAGPDVRWIGNEHGFAGETNWSTIDRTKVLIGQVGIQDYLNEGEEGARDWVPGECDTSIRPGWFWHPTETPKSLEQLLEIYFKSVGRNCVLLLNVPPNRDGRLDERDVARLHELRQALDTIFGEDLVEGASVNAAVVDGDPDSYLAADTLLVELPAKRRFNVVRIQEPISLGQRIAAYRVECRENGAWRLVSRGTTVGHKKLDRLDAPVTADRVRLIVERSRAVPLVAEFGLHFDPYER